MRIKAFALLAGIAVAIPSVAQVVDGTDIKLFQKFTAGGSAFSLDSTSRIVFLSGNGNADNQRLIEKLSAPRGLLQKLRYATGLDLQITITGSSTSKDIVLSDMPDAALTTMFENTTLTIRTLKKDISGNVEREGYQYDVDTSGATLKFKNDLGAIRAIQSLIQIVMQDGAAAGAHRSLPAGDGIDYPKFEDRIIMLDVGRWFMPKEQLIGLMEKMSQHKVNVLHMHLNEETSVRGNNNQPFAGGNDVRTGYFRLDIGDSVRQAAMTPDGRYYTKEDWDDIETAAKRYGIEIIPEFGSPGHSLSWLQDPSVNLPEATTSGRPPNLATNSPRNRQTVAEYMTRMIMNFKDWFTTTDTFHIGIDEGFANNWNDEVTYANLLASKIKCPQQNSAPCWTTLRMWETHAPNWRIPGSHPISGINFAPEYGFWEIPQTLPAGFKASTRWIDALSAKYWVPGYTGYTRFSATPKRLYDLHRDSTISSHLVGKRYPSIPFGLQYSLWNDHTQSRLFIGTEDEVINAGVSQSIPGMGLIGWNSEVYASGATPRQIARGNNRLGYAQTSFDDLIPVSQEGSSYWLVDRFPYLAQTVAMSIFTDTARYAKIDPGNQVPSVGSWWQETVVAGNKDEIWTAWDTKDMAIALAGPVTLRGMVAADIVGEGNMMSSGKECNDLGFLFFREREVSACDEDTWSNNIGGTTGSLVKKGVGHLRLLGAASTFAGGVMLEGGILEIGGDGSLGAAAGRVTFAGGTLSFAADAMLPSTRNMVISSGKTGAINASGNEVGIAGVISGAGTLKIVSMAKVTVTSRQQKELIGGQGTVTVMVNVIDRIEMQPVPGTVELSGVNTFTGGIMLEGGVLAASAAGALGAGAVTFAGGTLSFGSDITASQAVSLSMNGFIDTSGNDAIMSGVFSGRGDLRKMGQGSLELRGANTYTGATRVAAGMLKADISALPDASDIYTTAGATVELSTAADGKHDGDIFGGGLLKKAGSNVLTLKGASQANWQIIAGSVVSEGSFTGNVAFVGPRRVFEFRQGSDSSYAGVFSGSGEVVKSGGAALVLTGDSSAFSGEFNIEANSTMFVDGMLGGDVNVKASGVLGGRGKVGGDVVVASAGKLAASRATGGQLTIGGNLDLAGQYEVNFGAGGMVDGTADISSGSLKVLNGLFSPFNFDNDNSDSDSSQFFVLRSGGALTGPFASVDTSMLPFMRATVVYDTSGTGGTVRLAAGLDDQALADLLGIQPVDPPPVEMTVEMTPVEMPDTTPEQPAEPQMPARLPQVNTNKNQIAEIINANEQQDAVEQDEVIKELSDAIMMLVDDPDVDSNLEAKTAVEKRDEILESVAAEIQASSKSALIVSSSEVGSAAAGQIEAAFGDTLEPGSIQETRFNLEKKRWGFDEGGGTAIWAKALAGKGRNEGEGEFADIEHEGGTAILGVDAGFGDNWRLGGFAGVSKWEFSQLGDVDTGGEDRSRHIGFYGGMRQQHFSLRGGLVYTSHEVSARRTALVLGKLISEYEAKTYGLFAEVSHRIERHGVAFEPFAGANYVRHNADSFSERREDGSNASNIAEEKTIMGRAELGLRAFADGPGSKVYGALAWNVPFKDPDIVVRQSLGASQSADIQGAPIAGNGISLKAGLDFAIQENMNLNLAYSYSRLTSSNRKYGFEGRIIYRF